MGKDGPLRRIHNERDKGFSAAVVVPMGATVKGGFEAEARQCFANIRVALQRAGADFKNVVRITAYVKDLADYPIYSKVRSEVFGSDWPASASVGVSDLLLGAKLEVDAIAVIGQG
jgi:enamine deaminase RidA (YjgF/YER057c/UK114 family)